MKLCFSIITLVFIAFGATLDAQQFRKIQTIPANGANVTLFLYQSSDDAIIEFRAVNRDATLYGVKISTDLENMQANAPLPFTGTIPAKAQREVPLFRIERIDAGKAFYFRNLNWQLQAGMAPADPAKPVVHNGIYDCPWPKKKTFTVDNGFNGYGGHQGIWGYATDFSMPEGSQVLAAREGTVSALEQSFTQGGNDPALGPKANYVYVLHSDGSTGRYLHFKHNGVKVRVGQKVRRGQLIGLSGNVGWSTGPHLHFDVVVPDTANGMKTIPFKFFQKGRPVEPVQGMRLSH
ncbi:MAG: M23 family metallopeptidase [Spirochaetes bacterium]|nr:M23 family metallopeptidase [Spirochaetota bacterium]